MQGYEADNPSIELLRLRNFTAGCKLKEDEVLSPSLLDRISEAIGCMVPFVSALVHFFVHAHPPFQLGGISTHTCDRWS